MGNEVMRRFSGGRRRAMALAAATLALLAPQALRATNSNGKFERKLAVEGPVDVDVQTAAGNISVRMVTGSSVRVSGEVRVKTGLLQSDSVSERKLQQIISHPPIQQHGNSITIGRVRDSDLRRDTFISYEIEVPADTRLRSNTGLGDLQVEGLRGPVTADTGAGKVTISGVTGEVRANTGLGDVMIKRVTGNLRADSAAGNISAEGEPGGTWRLTTGLGDVRVHLLGETGLDLHAETGLGEILTKFPLKVEGAISHELRGKVRGGGHLIELKSGAGNIHIE
jgi:DUF4097 and DUF4098 domain-containing protein YvlB